MQLNGVNVDYQIPAASPINTDVGLQSVNGLNTVNEGDVVSLVSDGGAANASSVPGYYTVVVREASAAA
jgi:thiazole synthase ThiGH ThiG subunit